jgi:hypothetical protein
MREGDEPRERKQRNKGHDLKLKLQSVYVEYKHASKALESYDQSTDESPSREVLRLAMLEGQQRLAFERYVEAKMEFLEFRIETNSRSGPHLVIPNAAAEYTGMRRWLAAGWRPALEAAAVLLLCATALSGIRQQKRIGEMERTRDKLGTALNQTRDRLQILGQELELSKVSEHSRIRQIQDTPPEQEPRETRAAVSGGILQQKSGAMKGEASTPIQIKNVGARTYYTFSLTISRQFERIGPLEVSLRSIDTLQNSVSIAIVSDALKMEERHLQLNKPVWLPSGYRQQPLELVVNRIVGNRIDGGLVEPRVKTQ